MITDFFKTVIKLKEVKRKGWVTKLNSENVESVADHSYSMTIMGMILADLHGLDSKKIMQMVVLHDLAESNLGDFTPDEITKEKKYQLENNEMKKILSFLPEKLYKNYLLLWEEFLKNESEEARFVHELDKLEMYFQANRFLEKGFSKEQIQSFFDTATNEIKNSNFCELISSIENK